MTMKYTRIRIHIENMENVRLEIYDLDKVLKGEPTGRFGYNDPEVGSRLMESNQKARENRLTGPETAEFGNLLFSTLFDDKLKQKFLEIYQEAREKEYVIRMELDVDERLFPQIAALPWEFMHQPTGDLSGEIWLATAPKIVFSRRRALWSTPAPTRLNEGESLRIAIAVSTPYDLGPVRYESILKELNEKSIDEGFSISTQVNIVDKRKIDALLEQKPHIFHFIGHGRMMDENNRETGQLALTDDPGRAVWIDAAAFGELFNLHTPALVFLHACESGTLSSTRAFTGIASQLVQMKIPAVLAMQYEVSNATAQGFALEFYRSLAKNEPVDCAAQQARRFIAHGRTGYEKRDFATPVLFMNAAEGFLFDNKPCVNPIHIMKERLAGKKNELYQLGRFLKRMGLVAAVIFLVIVLGFILTQGNRPFYFTVYLQDSDGRTVLKNQGQVCILLDNNPVNRTVDENGAADFKGIPPKFMNSEVTVKLNATGWRFTNGKISIPCKLKGNNATLIIERDDSLARLSGTVIDELGHFITGAKVVVKDLVAYSDENGRFSLEIPREKQEEKQLVSILKEGYEPYRDYVSPANPTKLEILLNEGTAPLTSKLPINKDKKVEPEKTVYSKPPLEIDKKAKDSYDRLIAKEGLSIEEYWDFKKTYPNSRGYISKLKSKLKKDNPTLPPDIYWDNQDNQCLKKNNKGYYEFQFGKEYNGHIMIYIPMPKKKFWIDKFEVSYGQYYRVMKKFSKNGYNYPVRDALYKDAIEYCRECGLRLPFESEWEYAAGGKEKFKYPWGDEPPIENGKCRANYKNSKDGYEKTAKVQEYEEFTSPFGVFNMAGNVCEWTQEMYLKGGGYRSPKKDLEIRERRIGNEMDKQGFRCVKDEN
jgi:hypothetical protein